MSLSRDEIEAFWETWLEVNREAERLGDWKIMAEWYAEDATYGWMYTPDEHFMAVGRKEIRVHDVDVPVTRIEFALFEQLCRRPAEVCSRSELLEEVWGPNWVGDTHVVDVHLSNLRRKLKRHAPELRFIHTVRGVGFRLSNDLLHAAAESHELASA